MITKWTVSNFKSIKKETTLDFKPLTIFAGANSSGKSTILQSILLISQTLANKVSSRSVVLNGALTRLGQFDDLKSHGTDENDDKITIGWECRPNDDPTVSRSGFLRSPTRMLVSRRGGSAIREISCQISFDANSSSADRDLYQLQPQLFLFKMGLLVRQEDKIDLRHELTVSRAPSVKVKVAGLSADEPVDDALRESLSYDVDFDDAALAEVKEDFASASPIGCMLEHFLPERITVRINEVEEAARAIRAALSEDIPRYRARYMLERDLVLPSELVEAIQQRVGTAALKPFIGQTELPFSDAGYSLQEWIDRTWQMPPPRRLEFLRKVKDWPELPDVILSSLKSKRDAAKPEHQLLVQRPPSDFLSATYYLNHYFANGVRYLGPLRDEPKPLYPLAAHADPTDVGLRGEMTAAVLNLHRERKIQFIPPTAFEKPAFDASLVPRSLDAAVTDWLKYLRVADAAQSIDRGKLGHELKVSLAENGPKHDLTHVGVGVSQVLPILVSALLAGPDTTLIFEQPELHLHPMVQTRLGDFFLSIALAGKQCLIETHSEYLISRLRYRAAAEVETSRVKDSLKMYFVEKRLGTSEFRDVAVNEYGAIEDWPEGFFDQGPRESEAILRAAMKKRTNGRGT